MEVSEAKQVFYCNEKFSPLLVFLAQLPPLLCLFDQQHKSQKLFVFIDIQRVVSQIRKNGFCTEPHVWI